MTMRALLLAFALLRPADSERTPPKLPLQFSADLEITAHLVDRTKDYPPWLRKIKVHYDHTKKLARAEISAGYEAGRTYIRRYDTKREYMVKSGEFAECQRSYLGEAMPAPELPAEATFVEELQIDGKACEHWVHDLGVERVHIYQTADTKLPFRLMDESVEDGGQVTPLMTYDFKNVQLGPQDEASFQLPKPYTHKKCTRHIGGWPYLHVFHWYLRF